LSTTLTVCSFGVRLSATRIVQICTKIINLLNDLYPLAKLDLDYSLPKIKQGYMGDDIDMITSDPESAKAYAAKKGDRLAAAAAAAAAEALLAPVPVAPPAPPAPVVIPHQALVSSLPVVLT
jgi:hypothetical protein